MAPVGTVVIAKALALPAGLALIVVATRLARRRRWALWAGVALLAVLGGTSIAEMHVGPALMSWGVAAFLVWGREAFCVRRSPRAPSVLGDGTLARPLARDLVRLHGSDTLSAFKLRGDVSHLFSADRRAFLSYRVEGRVMVVSGDPVGPPDALPGLVREACDFAETRGLRIGVVGAGEASATLWAGAGLEAFYIGDEAIVDTAAFSLEGRAIRKVRQSVNRLEREGYSAEALPLGDLDETRLDQLERMATRWLEGEPERGFSMAMDSLRGGHIADSVVVLARDADGDVRGFLHFVPAYGRSAMSLSAMRRDRETPNGLTEFLVVRSVELLRDRGVAEVSLNFAAFARLLYAPAGRVERILGRLASRASSRYQIESLYRFNAKFFPRWVPRYLLYERATSLVSTGLAALRAEGQLPRVPRPWRPQPAGVPA